MAVITIHIPAPEVIEMVEQCPFCGHRHMTAKNVEYLSGRGVSPLKKAPLGQQPHVPPNCCGNRSVQ